MLRKSCLVFALLIWLLGTSLRLGLCVQAPRSLLQHATKVAQAGTSKRFWPMPKGRYTVSLRDVNGMPYDVRVFDPHEKVRQDTSPGGEFRGAGGRYYTGTYQVALRCRGANGYIIERIPLFGTDTVPEAQGIFTPWNRRVLVLWGKVRRWPDLLLITQDGSSNGDFLRVFFVQNSVLVPVTWHRSGKQTDIAQFVNGGRPLLHLHDNIFATSYYANGGSEAGHHRLIWHFQPQSRQMQWIKDAKL